MPQCRWAAATNASSIRSPYDTSSPDSPGLNALGMCVRSASSLEQAGPAVNEGLLTILAADRSTARSAFRRTILAPALCRHRRSHWGGFPRPGLNRARSANPSRVLSGSRRLCPGGLTYRKRSSRSGAGESQMQVLSRPGTDGQIISAIVDLGGVVGENSVPLERPYDGQSRWTVAAHGGECVARGE